MRRTIAQRVVYAKDGCRDCKGSGYDNGEPCECIHDQLLMGGKDAFIRLADGDIEIREAE